jgi:hypothetical protein
VASDFVFHIRNAHPSDMVAALVVLAERPGVETVSDIVTAAESLGFSIRDRQRLEALMTCRDLGLVSSDMNVLLPLGETLVAIEARNPDLFNEVVHGLQYALWDRKNPARHCFSWSYRLICQVLWSGGNTDLIDIRRNLASEIEGQARQVFDLANIVVGPKSVGGALLWLSELRPAVVDEALEQFRRRMFCAPETFTMAVNFVYKEREMDYGSNLLLTDENRDEICRFCLLDPVGFERVLDYAIAQFDFLNKGLGGGWGRYLTLQRALQMEDIG